MKVYHGSWLEISNPDLEHSRMDVDFGKGFYTTLIWEQAVSYTHLDVYKRQLQMSRAE